MSLVGDYDSLSLGSDLNDFDRAKTSQRRAGVPPVVATAVRLA